MKRRDLIRHLLDNGCELLREGARHSVPRHREVHEFLARKNCRDLGIPGPS